MSAEKPNSAETSAEEEETVEVPAREAPKSQEREMAELTDSVKRIQADFDNFKKRMDREWQQRTKLAHRSLMIELLPVLDSFDKALESSGKASGNDNTRKGLEGLYKQLVQVLQRQGLREIPCTGKFDPFLHEALMREEDENAEDGKILEVYQKGYAIGSDPIRTAKVKVAKRKEPAESRITDHDSRIERLTEEEQEEGDE